MKLVLDGAEMDVANDAPAHAPSLPPALLHRRRTAASVPNDAASLPDAVDTPAFRLGAWNFYFLAKLVLFWQGMIGLHPLENLAFAAFMLAPLHSPVWRRIRAWVAVPIGAALLYYDSWLPPLARALSQVSLLLSFNLAYLAELLGRFVSWPVLAALVLAWAVYRIVAMRVRVGVLVVTTLIGLAITDYQPGANSGAGSVQAVHASSDGGAGALDGDVAFDAALREFYAREAQRSVAFARPGEADQPFDVILVHVCSLSWDDLRMMGLEKHPLWTRFDIVLTRFNSAASYSGPAAIRVLRGPCGQTSHTALYSPAPDGCYLMGSLAQAGFERHLVLNHDGHFDDFLGILRGPGGLDSEPMPLDGMPVAQRSFDNSPIYNDLAVLSRWLDQRRQSQAPRVAAFFNTVSLHDGNHLVGPDAKRNSQDTYQQRLAKLLDDLDAFIVKLESSGRRAVLALVPEHGGALRGDKMQIPGLREIPSPAITLVPVGIKVVGAGAQRAGATLHIDASTSYLAVSHIIARMLEKSPFAAAGYAPADYVADLPATNFVAENEDMVTMRRGDAYFLRLGKEGWSEYSASAQ